VAASEAVRAAHVAVISGRSADVAASEAAHASTLRDATARARAFMAAAGEKATPATMAAISETLQALPTPDPAGRLTRPFKPAGFAALMALGIDASAPLRAPEADGRGSGLSKGRAASAARQAARKRAQKAANTAHAEAVRALSQAERELGRVQDRLAFLEKRRADAEETVRRCARRAQDAANARIQAAQELAAVLLDE
jgi:hypothetical protein